MMRTIVLCLVGGLAAAAPVMAQNDSTREAALKNWEKFRSQRWALEEKLVQEERAFQDATRQKKRDAEVRHDTKILSATTEAAAQDANRELEAAQNDLDSKMDEFQKQLEARKRDFETRLDKEWLKLYPPAARVNEPQAVPTPAAVAPSAAAAPTPQEVVSPAAEAPQAAAQVATPAPQTPSVAPSDASPPRSLVARFKEFLAQLSRQWFGTTVPEHRVNAPQAVGSPPAAAPEAVAQPQAAPSQPAAPPTN